MELTSAVWGITAVCGHRTRPQGGFYQRPTVSKPPQPTSVCVLALQRTATSTMSTRSSSPPAALPNGAAFLRLALRSMIARRVRLLLFPLLPLPAIPPHSSAAPAQPTILQVLHSAALSCTVPRLQL